MEPSRGRAWKPTPLQIAYRCQEVARMWREGCAAAQIAAALNVDEGTVRRDLRRLEIPRVKRYAGADVDPAPVEWLSPPAGALAPPPSDRVAFAIRHFLAEMRRARYESAHACDVLDARRRQDEAWLASWGRLASDLRQVAETLTGQHEVTGDLRASVLGRASRPAPDPPPRAGRAGRNSAAPPRLREEIRALVAAGQAVGRARLARKHDVGEHMVQLEHQRALAREELIDAGWRPPPGAG